MEVVKEEYGKDVECKMDDRPSSPTDCAICLEQLTDKSFTNSCLHMFCFHCLLAWSKVKPECPLCKQDFCSIIHNIRSMTDYDEYHVPRPVVPRLRLNPFLSSPPSHFFDADVFTNHRRFFSYRTTLMSNDYSIPPERPTNLVIQPYVNDLEIQNDFSRSNSLHLPASRPNRREVYLRELETHPPPSGGRYRECSPEFYRENEGQLHRLARWLNRELFALSQIGVRFIQHEVQHLVMDMLKIYSINSELFFTILNRYLGTHTRRFIREFYNFATSPFEMDYYDRECFYVRQRNGSHLSFIVTVGRDDTEDVQVIPSTSMDPPVRPWIDVNDLNTLHYHPSGSGIQISTRVGRQHAHRPHSTTQTGADAYSHSVIDITDSENDDCVIVDEVSVPETIVLDDSDSGAETVIASGASVQCSALDLSTSKCSTSQVPESSAATTANSHSNSGATCSACITESKKNCRRNSEVERHGKLKHGRSGSSTSVVSTDFVSTEECDHGGKCLKSKKRKSKKYYKTKSMRKCASSKHKKMSDEDYVFFSSDSVSDNSDKDGSDWEVENRKSKKRSKRVSATKRDKKTKSRKRKKLSESKTTKKKRISISDISTESNDDDEKRAKKMKRKQVTDQNAKRGPSLDQNAKRGISSEQSAKRGASLDQSTKLRTSLESEVTEASRPNVPKLRSVVKKVNNNCCFGRGTSNHSSRGTVEYDEDNAPSTSYGYNGYRERATYGSHLSGGTFSSDSD